jgi:hypothetical protein
MPHDASLIPWEQEAAFIEGVATDESDEIGVDELLARDAAAAALPARPPARPGRSADGSACPPGQGVPALGRRTPRLPSGART